MSSRNSAFRLEALEARVMLSGDGVLVMEQPDLMAVPAGLEISTHYEQIGSGPVSEVDSLQNEIAPDALFEGATDLEIDEEPGLHAMAGIPNGATITVNSIADTNSRDGSITLREAILISNGTLNFDSLDGAEKVQISGAPLLGGMETIHFSIGSGPQTIFVTGGGLPFITDPVFIDGTTQPGFSLTTHIPILAIDASGAGTDALGKYAAGLEITGGNSTVKGLIIKEARGEGIRIREGGGNKILGNLIGSFLPGNPGDLSGTFGNDNGMLILNSPNNQVGGMGEGERNIISGNRFTGLVISGSASTGNRVYGNRIGTDLTGTQKLPNGLQGILITGPVGTESYASGNFVGGTEPGQGNLISGNTRDGVEIVRGADNRIQGNLIGTDIHGTGRLGNGFDGIGIVDAPRTLIGGEGLAGNVISANGQNGIEITGNKATGNRIENNLIGTDLTGFSPLGNEQDGIFFGNFYQESGVEPVDPPAVSSPASNSVGGTTVSLRNVISSNLRDGIHLEAGTETTKIEGNYIGLTLDGLSPLSNVRHGVAIIDSPMNLVGGIVIEKDGVFQSLPRNVISANKGAGVLIEGIGSRTNAVVGNFIGLNKDGTAVVNAGGPNVLGNETGVRIEISASDNTIGAGLDKASDGTVLDQRNIISGNILGVLVLGDGNRVQGNYIGTDVTGTNAIGNKLGGVHIAGDNNTVGGVRLDVTLLLGGNLISGNAGFGVRIGTTGTGNTVRGNFIGTDATGFARLGNTGDGVLLENASGNTIGGAALAPGFAPGNVISGNQGHGIFILGTLGASNNKILGNVIGLSDSGVFLGNAGNGVRIQDGTLNQVGGLAEGEGNVISGNNQQGVEILRGAENKVWGNFIGTDKTGTFASGNFVGVLIQGSHNNTIGGTTAAARNVISGNIDFGISIIGTSSRENRVIGNYIGLDRTGNVRIGNTQDGVLLSLGASGNFIGGPATGERNYISANFKNGVRIADSDTVGNLIQGNYIGLGVDGTTKLGNEEHGVFIEGARNNTIGGEATGAGNVIAFNGNSLSQKGHGVVVHSGNGNQITRNSIHGNAGRGIDLGNDSFTLNHVGPTVGANDFQNHPVVTSVDIRTDSKFITWSLVWIRNTDLTIEFFSNTAPDPAGFGEGEKFLKSIVVRTNEHGFAEFTDSFPRLEPFISATATDENKNTSEFSLVDTDADALADAWEDPSLTDNPARAGIDINEDGIIDLNLGGKANSLGVFISAYHKDLFVEVDAMSGALARGGTLVAPTQATLDRAVTTFAQAPNALVHNPDGTDGITLHAILDESTIAPATFLSMSGKSWPEFDAVKLQFFGTATERAAANWASHGRAAKELAYRYNVFADLLQLPTSPGKRTSSGYAELFIDSAGRGLGGSDFIVTLGTWIRSNGPDGVVGGGDDVFGGTDDEQAGTFMHELGHTLGLFHSGDQIEAGVDGKFGTSDDKFPNLKPNYRSIMNYLWQTPERWMFEDVNGNGSMDGAEKDQNDNAIFGDSEWTLDYSRRVFFDLNEQALHETVGIGGDEFFWVQIGTSGNVSEVREFGPADFNNNGTIDVLPVVANINSGDSGQLLRGFEDWSHLRFGFRELPNLGTGLHGKEGSEFEELDLELKEELGSRGSGAGLFVFSRRNTFQTDEGSGVATIIVQRTGGSSGEVTVNYTTTDGTALAGADYSAASGTLTFANGEYVKTISVPILDDAIGEAAKVFRIQLSNPTGGATIGPDAEAAVVIADNDGAGRIEFSTVFYVVNETDPTATITVQRAGGALGPVTVQFTTANISANAGQDYTLASGTLNFSAGEASRTFSIPIRDDSLVEGIETLRVSLSNPGGGAVLGTIGEAVVIIKDVEAGVVELGDSVFQAGESDGSATISLIRTGGSDGAVTVNFATANGSAIAGVDYEANSGTVTFQDGETFQTITLSILNDSLAEAMETLPLALSNPTGGAILGARTAAEVRIIDDEATALQFETPTYVAVENAGTATVRVIRIGNTDTSASIEFATGTGTARLGADYAANAGIIQFAPGETSKTFTISLFDDRLGDGTKTVQVRLMNPAGALLGLPDTATLSITDDETLNGATFVVTNTNDSGAGSLRQAILNANARAGTDFITFDIPGTGIRSIQPLSPLPLITSPVTIDGFSQPGTSPNTATLGSNAVLLIQLKGLATSLSSSPYLLRINAGDSIVRGLVLNSESFNSGSITAIQLETKGGNLVEGNYIGTDAAGLVGFGNYRGIGILNSSDNIIGGKTPAARNIISANVIGLMIESSPDYIADASKSRGNQILGNFFGVGADGTTPLGNFGAILISTVDGAGITGKPAGNVIGGIEPGAGNVIGNSRDFGVSINTGRGNVIRGNSIFGTGSIDNSQTRLGIDLVSTDALSYINGPVTLNDPKDADTGDSPSGSVSSVLVPGPNRLQNFPVLSSALNSGGVITITGRLESAPKTTFQLDFYASSRIGARGYGDGETYIGTMTVTTGASGRGEFTAQFNTAVADGQFITATATDPNNNTSEFSARITVGDVLGGPIVVNTTDDIDDGVADERHTSLREAIHEANNHPGADTITFNIPGTGVQRITPKVNLPAVTEAVTIDGYSQPGARPNTQTVGFDGVLLIELTKGPATFITTVLNIAASDSTVRGLVVNGMDNGLVLQNGTNNRVEGNIIGANPAGNTYASTGFFFSTSMTMVSATKNVIGGIKPESRNLIEGLALIRGANNNRVQGNYFGTRADGLGLLVGGKPATGLFIENSGSNLIGGSAPGEGNVIAGTGTAIYMSGWSFKFGEVRGSSTGNRVIGNYIGVGADGLTLLPNTFGIEFRAQADNNYIGGIQPGAGNIIAGSRIGILLESHDASEDATRGTNPKGNAIRGNSIYSNVTLDRGLGIDIDAINWEENGTVSLNDNADFDGGGNNSQNFPVLESALTSSGVTTIRGRLDSAANGTYQIDFYLNDQMDPTGYGQGKVYLGTAATTTNATGHGEFSLQLPAVADGLFVTATATSSGNDTSEFSARLEVGDTAVLGSVFIVNTTDDFDDGIADAQHTSLREAIHASNNHPGHDTILFNIPGEGLRTIAPLSLLPAITDAVTIDGYSQPGSRPNTLASGDDAVLMIEIKSGGRSGFYIRSGDSIVRGLAITGFQFDIFIAENGRNVIQGNFIGTNADGMVTGEYLRIYGSKDNLIGGTSPAERNLISVLEIRGFAGTVSDFRVPLYFTSGNLVQNNEIRVVIMRASTDNVIGGTTPEARNVISGSLQVGGHAVQGTFANNRVQGNYIGTDRAGLISNGGITEVFLSGNGNVIGGAAPGAGNIIGAKITTFAESSDPAREGDHIIQGNWIGVASDGISALGTITDAIEVRTSRNLIGGTAPGAGNVISGNGGNGIVLTGQYPTIPTPTANVIQGNFIGTLPDGVTPLGNAGDGILVLGTKINFSDPYSVGAINVTIGGTTAGAGNTIAFNRGTGVNLAGGPGTGTAGSRIAILSNSIYSNGKLGIDLKGDGPTANDAADIDSGDNSLQNFPIIISTSNSGDSITIQGTLNSRPNLTYRLEFFDSIAFDSSNFGEGQRFIGATTVTADATGNASFNLTLPVTVAAGHIITATATDPAGNTSEFSGRQIEQPAGATAELAVSFVATPNPVLLGSLLTHEITVTNNGPDTATNVMLFDSLTNNASFSSAVLSQGNFVVIGTQVLLSFGTIPSGGTATAQIQVLPKVTGALTNTVQVGSDQFDSNAANNTATATTTVRPVADLSISKSMPGTEPVAIGSFIVVTIQVRNVGPSNATNVQVVDTMPEGMSFVSFNNFGGTVAGQVITWNLGTLPKDYTFSIFFTASVNQLGTSTNTAVITTNDFDPDTSNNSASAEVTVMPSADLALVGAANPASVAVGGVLTYSFSITNNGPSDATGVELIDTLPQNVTINSAIVSQGTFATNGNVITFDLGTVASGATITAQILVTPTVGGIFATNTASVTASGTTDLNPFNNNATIETIVSAPFPSPLYGVAPRGSDSVLMAIDPATGVAAPVGLIGFNRVSGMDFDPRTGILYGTGEDPATGEHVLITIDPRTGVGTRVGLTQISDIANSNNVTDMSFRNSDAALFGFLFRSRYLATIDIASGLATAVANTGVGNAGNALAFLPDGRLFHADDQNLNIIDSETGVATLVATLTFSAPINQYARLNAMDYNPQSGLMVASVNVGFRDSYLATVDLSTGAITVIGPTFEGLDALAFLPVTGENNAPVVTDDSYTVREDTPFVVAGVQGVLANDSDADGDALTVSLVGAPAHGTLTVNGDGSLSYSPTADFTGVDTFTYRISDGTEFSNVATVTFTVESVNDAPVGIPGSVTLAEDASFAFAVADFAFTDLNDAPSNGLLAVRISSLPSAGMLLINGAPVVAGQDISAAELAEGLLLFTPATNANANGYASFTFQVRDDGGTANGGSDIDPEAKTITINIIPVNDAPSAVDDSYTTTEDSPLIVSIPGVLANDSDSEGDSLSAVLVNGPANGTLTLNGDGSFSYTPTADFHGSDNFTYRVNDGNVNSNVATVSITVLPVNDAPMAIGDSYTIAEDNVLNVLSPGALANDSDTENDVLGAMLVSGPAMGTLTLNGDGSFSYTPAADFHGSDSFTYRVNDGSVNSNVATVSITVLPVNDAPMAIGDSYTISEVGSLLVVGPGVLGNDSDADGDGLTAILGSGPAHGTLTLNSDGSFTYTPSIEFNGNDGFTYRANDGTADSNMATVAITVSPVNDAPVAVGENYTTSEDSILNVAGPGVLGNDSDADGDGLTAILVSGPAHGILTLNGDGSFSYTPAADFNGNDGFTYRANDGTADSNMATVAITVSPVNDAPVAVGENYTTSEDSILNVAGPGVLGNDSDADGDGLTAILVSGPAHGTLTFNGDGSFSYTPSADFNGEDSFTYRTTDGQAVNNLSEVARVLLIVLPVNDAPAGAGRVVTIGAGTAYIFAVEDFGFSDPKDNPPDGFMAVVITTLPGTGSLTLHGRNVVAGQLISMADVNARGLIFTPEAGAVGRPYTNFTFQVRDNGGTENGGSDVDAEPRLMVINIASGNEQPVLKEIIVTPAIDEGGTVTLTGAFIDSDAADTHLLVIDWGEGGLESISLAPGARTFQVTHQYRDDDPSGTPEDEYAIAVTVKDQQGAEDGKTTVTVVRNVAPGGTVTGPSHGVRGQTLSFEAMIYDAGVKDTHQVTFDFGDGTATVTRSSSEPGALTPSHIYTATGKYRVTLTVRDDDGGVTVLEKKVEISAAELQVDVCDPDKTALVIGGTTGSDTIRVVPKGSGSSLKVIINGSVLGLFNPTGRVVVFGQSGNDDIEIASGIWLPALLQGDSGKDRLKAGYGPSVLLGGDGDDYLIGSKGRSILIGGNGADRIVGGRNGDILIAGSTAHDADHEKLCDLLDGWGRADLSYAQRIELLTTGPIAFTTATLFGDCDRDSLTGGSGLDWFIVGAIDKISGLKKGEVLTGD